MEDAMMKRIPISLTIILMAAVIGCTRARVKLFPDAADPLKEFTLSGKASDKVLLIPVKGVISDTARERVFRTQPSMVQEVVSQLKLAEKDKQIRAVVLKIDSPGGSVTATDLLYHELTAFREKSGVKLVAVMMNLATSGGYYIALPADRIVAHPTTLTGSIGVLLLRPDVSGLMEKIGLDVTVNKSGRNKDMGSPFRKATEEEEKILQELSDTLGRRFVDLVARHRKMDSATLSAVGSARVYLADDARRLGLVDDIGYIDDAVKTAKALAGLPEDARVVVYRRTENPNDNLYNTTSAHYGRIDLSILNLGLPESMTRLQAGFYYLWPTVVSGQ
jgi:protease IV